jgi:hypothetical protein
LEVRFSDSLVAQQKCTPFKARIAFEEDVKEQLIEMAQRLVLLENNFARSTKTQASERESLMKTGQDIIDRVASDFDSAEVSFEQHKIQIKALEQDRNRDVNLLKTDLLAKRYTEKAIQEESSKTWGKTHIVHIYSTYIVYRITEYAEYAPYIYAEYVFMYIIWMGVSNDSFNSLLLLKKIGRHPNHIWSLISLIEQQNSRICPIIVLFSLFRSSNSLTDS